MAYLSSDQTIARRSASVWTKIHPLFALGQLAAFFVSVALLVAYFRGATTFDVVHESVLVKISLMIGAIVTGALWERDVYGAYWFAPAFLGEDTMTVIVFILHVGYLMMVVVHPDNIVLQLGMLIVAYGVYVTNVAQYILRTHMINKQLAAVRVRA